jgi:NAD(P)-dependent dehydrogenase (short-subunit alcohol dehydrogenase family)
VSARRRPRTGPGSAPRVLVTGADQPVGAATSALLRERGARVAEVPGGAVTGVGPLRAAVDAAVAGLGGLDAVIAAAGVGGVAGHGSVTGTDPAAFAATVEAGVLGVYRTMHATIPALTDSRGYFLAVGSHGCYAPAPGLAAGAASTAATESLADALRMEARHRGITVGMAHLPHPADQPEPASVAALRCWLRWPHPGAAGVADCAAALAGALAHRRTRVFVPRRAAVLRWLRPVLTGRTGTAAAARLTRADLAALDGELAAGRGGTA